MPDLAVIHLLPALLHACQVLAQAAKAIHLVQPADLVPGLLWQPGAGAGVRVVQPHAACQQEAPLAVIHLGGRGQHTDCCEFWTGAVQLC